MFSFSFSGTMSDCNMQTLTELAAEQWLVEIARIRRQSLCSGMEVVYDLSMFDEEWHPVYFHTSDDPIAWLNPSTGERIEGAAHPVNRS